MSEKPNYEQVVFDDFDIFVSNQSGDARDLLENLYGHSLKNKGNAEKYMAGVRVHLETKKELAKKEAKILGEDKLEAYPDKNEWIATKTIRLSEDEKDDPVSIMKEMELDPAKWKLNWFKRRLSDWNVTIKNKDWEGEQYLNRAYSCEVSVTPKQDIITSDGIQRLFEDFEPFDLEDFDNQYDSPLCLALPLVDSHIGKHGLTIQEQVDIYKSSVLDIMAEATANGRVYEEIVLQIGQDDFHIDNANLTTSAGTRMEVNDDWSNIYKAVVDLYGWTIEQVRPFCNTVYVYYVPGNHDETLGLAAAYHYEKGYEDLESVVVESEQYPRKYHRFGVNMFGMSHGRNEGKKRIKTVMQYEASEMWGKTLYREFLLADEHHEETNEEGGIIYRRISSTTNIDDWHLKKAYVMATRKAQALVYDMEKGKRLTIDSNVDLKLERENML